MSILPTNKMRMRVNITVFLIILAVTVYICVNLFNVSVIKSEYYRSKANNQQLNSFVINANRGTIYDSNGKVLAQSSTVWDVIVNPQDIAKYDSDKKELICKTLSQICDVEYNDVLAACNRTEWAYSVIKSKVDKDTKDAITKFRLDNELATYSVYTVENSKREYPNENLASSVIGFVNYDGNGVTGIEAYYDEYLQGVDGKIVTARDANGKAMPYQYETRYEAQNGNSLYLTIDEKLQYSLEKNLEMALTQHNVQNRACGIIMNVNTGAVLAMATAPSFNLNSPATLSDYFMTRLEEYETSLKESGEEYSDEEIEKLVAKKKQDLQNTQWNNKAISELYIPGSVFKVITAASALEEQLLTPETVVATCLGVADVSGVKIRCWNVGGHGEMTLQTALIKSCNPSFIAIGNLLGARKFTEYFESFGLTEKTGIDLPAENSSLYVEYEKMGPVELASSSFGQTNKLTPIQMVTAYAAAVNGGYLVTPHIVDKIVDYKGNVIKTNSTEVKRQVISEETSAQMRKMLENVVENNGGSNAYIQGFRIGGKSGTSQKLDQYDEDNMRYVGSMCCFTPADDPEIIMLVMIDEPYNGKIYGSAVAAPVISAVFSECLENVGIYPQYTAEELAAQDTVVPFLIDKETLSAISTLNSAGLKYEIVGDENGKVVSTVPNAGVTIPKGGTVIVYTDESEKLTAKVPDVVGMTVDQANNALTSVGLNISLSGGAIENSAAKAISQSVAAGTDAYKGTVVRVEFIVDDETG